MLELITKKISNKIILALFILMSFSSLTIIFVTTSKVTENSIVKTKENLEMLNAAMFQSLSPENKLAYIDCNCIFDNALPKFCKCMKRSEVVNKP